MSDPIQPPSAGAPAPPAQMPTSGSTPFPLEEQAELEGGQGMWNPWQGQPQPRWYSGTGFDEDTAYLGPFYRVLAGMGQGAAKGEALLAGAAHSFNAFAAEHLGDEPVVGPLMKYEEERSGILEQDAAQRVKALTPDPATTGFAAQTLQNLASGAYRMAVGSLVGGPAGGAALLGTTEAQSRYGELREEGVSPSAAATSAAVSGAASAAGAFLPAGVGGSLISKILTGAATNAAFGGASRYADHLVLEAAGYPEMAQQERFWDGAQLFTDALLGGAFGVLAHVLPGEGGEAPEAKAIEARLSRDAPGAQDAALTLNLAMRARDASPGIPVDPGAANAHQGALETAIGQLLTDRPVNVADTAMADGETFAQRPAPEMADVQELFTNALKEGGVLEEQGNVQRLEQAIDARLRGERPEAPQAQDVQPMEMEIGAEAPEGPASAEDAQGPIEQPEREGPLQPTPVELPAASIVGASAAQRPTIATAGLPPAEAAIAEKPGMLIPDEDGNMVSAAQALTAAKGALAEAKEKMPGAMQELANCAARRGF